MVLFVSQRGDEGRGEVWEPGTRHAYLTSTSHGIRFGHAGFHRFAPFNQTATDVLILSIYYPWQGSRAIEEANVKQIQSTSTHALFA